ncbi:MAG TPA: glycerol kinase GlpK [Anaerolineales bacterium]|nr:glycerol kinase GlpK [Anaerolineales bacterium]
MPPYLLGLDQGTTGTFAGLMDSSGAIIARADREHAQHYPAPDRVEHDPDEIWRNVCELLDRVIAESGAAPGSIAGLGIANQGESVVLWDGRTGEALSPIIVWQDTRTQPWMDRAAADAEATHEIRTRTGLRLDAYFSASKMRWLLDHTPGIEAPLKTGRIRIGTLDTWLIWKLTGGRSYLTDPSTASRTLLFNIHTSDWDPWLLEFFGIPREILPAVVPTTADFGAVSHPDAAAARGVPIVASIVDQPAAMVGQGCLAPGTIKATYGTGCFINLNTGRDAIVSENGLLTLVAWQRDGETVYGLDGGVFTAGANLNWLRDQAGLIDTIDEIDGLCRSVPDAGGAVWVPAQVGLGAPHWDRNVRAAWLGIGLGTERAHLVRAVVEGIALRVVQIVRAMEADTGTPIPRLRADGGLTRSPALVQIQADLLGVPVEVLDDGEATARGVCSLAARAAGVWGSDDEVTSRVKAARVFEPASTPGFRARRLAEFNSAVSLLKSRPHA